MSELKLIPLDDRNSATFKALFAKPAASTAAALECTKLNPLTHEQSVAAFIQQHDAVSLKAFEHVPGKHFIFKADGAAPSALPALVAQTDAAYPAFIAALRNLISVKLSDDQKSIDVWMDPLPVGKEIAILFRANPAMPWSVASAKTEPKQRYVEGLLGHAPIPGLPMQLGITTFADGSRILNRFYLLGYELDGQSVSETFMGAATLYIQDKHKRVTRVLNNEDFILDKFQPVAEWLENQKYVHGHVIGFERVISASQCDEFVNGDGQFSISKTENQHAANDANVIRGRFLQHDVNGDPVIQSDNASVLEDVIYKVPNQPAVAILSRAPIVATYNGAREMPDVHAGTWLQQDVKRITKRDDGLKIDLDRNSYVIDNGNKIALYGAAQRENLKAMVDYARDNWNGQFIIQNGSEAVKLQLYQLAQEQGLKVIGYTPPVGSAPYSPAGRARQSTPGVLAA